jgi:hypothetical protein
MPVTQLPKEVAAAIRKCWPHGKVEEFDSSESYFHDIYEEVKDSLYKIPEARLLWESQKAEDRWADWDTGEDLPRDRDDWLSYHLFFVSPKGKEFEFETETQAEEMDEDSAELKNVTYPGRGWVGCTAAVSLAARLAAINVCDYEQFENGDSSLPGIETFVVSESTGERVDTDLAYRERLGERAFGVLEGLRRNIAAVLAKHGLRTLDQSILELTVQELKPGEGVFIHKPVRVRDAFFFRGVP